MSKKIQDLANFLDVTDLTYNENGAQVFSRKAKAALKDIAKQLKLHPAKVDFNRGGIAGSGEASLMGMFDEKVGICIKIDANLNVPVIMYRAIKNMKDFTGGGNYYLKTKDLHDENQVLIQKLEKVREWAKWQNYTS